MSATLWRFARYATIGVSTLLFDLGMLYIAVSIIGVPYYIATPITFLIAVSCNYALSRRFVFKGSTRSWHGGYTYFAVVAILGAVVTTTLVATLISYLGLYYLVARVLVAGLVGIGNYLFNLHLNFKVAGKHPTAP
jgi:putative flippase GtrA